MKAEQCVPYVPYVPYVRVKDARASLAYFERFLGFHKEWEHQFESGFPQCICGMRGGLRFFLTEHAGYGLSPFVPLTARKSRLTRRAKRLLSVLTSQYN